MWMQLGLFWILSFLKVHIDRDSYRTYILPKLASIRSFRIVLECACTESGTSPGPVGMQVLVVLRNNVKEKFIFSDILPEYRVGTSLFFKCCWLFPPILFLFLKGPFYFVYKNHSVINVYSYRFYAILHNWGKFLFLMMSLFWGSQVLLW